MKQLRLLLCLLCIGFLLTAAQAEEGYTTYQLGNTNFSISSDWLVKHGDDGKEAWFYAKKIGSIEGGYLYASLSDIDTTIVTDANIQTYYQSIANSAFVDQPAVELVYESNHAIGRANGKMRISDTDTPCCAAMYQNGAELLMLYYINPAQTSEEMVKTLDAFVESIEPDGSDESTKSSTPLDGANFVIDNLSYDELLALRDEIDAKLWASEEWEEVTVPAGVYLIGRDIPAGRWKITASGGYGQWNTMKTMDENGELHDYIDMSFSKAPGESTIWELHDGVYLSVSSCDVIFTHALGADLGFK